jgi:hypothetical protein
MRWTDLNNEELDLFVDMAKSLKAGIITASKFVEFYTNLEKNVFERNQRSLV